MPLSVLAELSGAHPDPSDVHVRGISLDSRNVQQADLYAALPGFHVHGARFAADAVRAGAVAVLTDPEGADLIADRVGEEWPGEVPILVVPNPRGVLGRVAAAVYADPASDLTMVGVTGTNGKTTTAYLLESGLRALGHRTGLVGTVETRIGDERLESVHTTPESTDLHAYLAVMRERGVDTCVMEVSSHALHQHRVDGVVYDVALFTNLSQDHLDYHATMEDYFQAKAGLFQPDRSRSGVVCVDDEWGRRLAHEAGVPVTTLSTTDTEADWVVAVPPRSGAPSSTAATSGSTPARGEGSPLPEGAFRLEDRSGSVAVDLVSHLPGTFNVANTALAALCLLHLGVSAEQVEAAFAVPPEVPGRMEVVSAGGPDGPRCIVDFAHTPDAVDAALTALRPSTSGRLIAVLGAGGDRDPGKREAMGRAAAERADVVVVTDDNPRSEDPGAIRGAVLAGARRAVAEGTATAVQVIDGGSRSQAIAEAIALTALDASPGQQVDTVVVLGKGHEKGQEIAGVKHPFDDRDAVRSALSAAGLGGAR